MDLSKITNLRANYSKSKVGYQLDDKKEFSIVRNTLVNLNMPTENFDLNLSNLVIESDSYTSGTSYNSKKDLITNPENSYDFIHELFHMASNNAKKESIGSIINIKGKRVGDSLNEGITDLFTYYGDNNYKQKYPIESFVASVLGDLYGKEIFINHFNGDSEKLYNCFGEDKTDVLEMILNLDEFTLSNIEFQDSISMIGSGFVEKRKYNPDNLSDSFVDSMMLLFRLVSSKDEKLSKKYFDILNSEFNKDNETINFLKSAFEMSSYENYDEVLNYIKEEIFEEEMKL